MGNESVVLILFVIASTVAVLAKRIHLPYTIALMAVGLALGAAQLLHAPKISQEMLYAIFLPGLIFEAAIHLRTSDMAKDFWLIAVFVIPGVIISTVVTAAVLVPASVWFAGIDAFTWPLAILFGAAVAATDPVSVISIFKELGAPRRLRLLIESESLLNDGTSIVVFVLAMQFLHGDLGTPQQALVDFFRIVGFGLLVGVMVGLLAAMLMRHLDDAMVTITVTTVAAYGSFLIADKFGVSGVMSTVATGLICGNKGFQGVLFPSIRITTEAFWEYIAFALNSLIFLLMGFAINLKMLWELWPVVLIAYVSVLLARLIVVSSTWAVFYPTRLHFPFRWSLAMEWGGLRGALSMVLVLSLPDSMAMKDVVVTLVFGVVLLSIFVQGLTMTPLLKMLGIISKRTQVFGYEELKARISLLEDALDDLDRAEKRRMLSKSSAENLKEEYQKQLDEAKADLDALDIDRDALVEEETMRFRRREIMAQKANLLELYQNGALNPDAYHHLKSDLDTRLLELENMGA
ncbi:sodium:proton antiporter [Sulfurovum sp.]|uniref:cation:proton antiporter n=1 Tax=Sulfurovum sp. TaxID=1969726 RepID=UPI0025D62FCB|nr:sodium:proton antiporter [Sulfurovum sp.]